MSDTELERFIGNELSGIRSAGLFVSQTHGPWRWPVDDATEESRAERLSKMKKAVKMTAMFGAEYFVIHPIMPYGVDDLSAGRENETWELNLSFMDKLLSEAKQNSVTVCLENMPMRGFSLASPEAILRFVREMNDTHFKICLDSGHAAIFCREALGDAVRLLGDEIKVLHVHDNHFSSDLHLMPFTGRTNWADFSKSLYDIDFDGVLSLETAPPAALPTPLFEQTGKLLNKYAALIAGKELHNR